MTAIDLPTTDANEAFDVLERNEPLPLGARVRDVGARSIETEDGDSVARGDLRARLEALGFRFIGRYSDSALGSLRVLREWWVDSSGAVSVSVARDSQKAESEIEAGAVRYFFVTRFDDGAAVMTWAKPKPPRPSTSRIEIQGGTGDLENDLSSHVEAARAFVAGTARRALKIEDSATARRAEIWHATRLRAPNVAQAIAGRVVLGAVGALAASLGKKKSSTKD
jgi:hypothetical protein